jgi:hypothetical protein
MRSWRWLLLCSLFAATVEASAFAGTNRDGLAGTWTHDHTERASPMMLAGSNGHDTVGGLMPLPLWPSQPVHPQGTVPSRSWKPGIFRHPAAKPMRSSRS